MIPPVVVVVVHAHRVASLHKLHSISQVLVVQLLDNELIHEGTSILRTHSNILDENVISSLL